MKGITRVIFIFISLSVILFGSIFLAVGLFLGSGEKDFVENGTLIKATITDTIEYEDSDGDILDRIYVTFEYNGKTYSNIDLNYITNSLSLGQEIEIYFKPHSEEVMYVEGNNSIKIIFIAFGSAICVIGIVILITGFIISNRIQPLNQQGTKYDLKYIGNIQQLEFIGTNSSNGLPIYIVHCSYTDNAGNVQYVKSGHVIIDPSCILPIGSPIDIYVDSKKSSRYFVDVHAAVNAAYTNMYNNYDNTNLYNRV